MYDLDGSKGLDLLESERIHLQEYPSALASTSGELRLFNADVTALEERSKRARFDAD